MLSGAKQPVILKVNVLRSNKCIWPSVYSLRIREVRGGSFKTNLLF